MIRRNYALLLPLLALATATVAQAEPAPFDLAGPSIEVKVTRDGATLPIAAVPNLVAGDQLLIKPELPANQSARYLLIAAFLRGSTNPPPADWFFRCETWTRPCAQQGLTLTVPAGAQQVLLFLAPHTTGDFKTLRGAVRGRPGAFVHASQDLNQATLDRSRLEQYLSALHQLQQEGPTQLKQGAPLLARSLAIKLDEKCLDKIPELQVPCLMEGQGSLILDDGHSTSIVEALTSGPASDLAMQASYTPQLSYGYYSPYIASVLDIARIMGTFDTAQYQYIPAMGTMHADQLDLTLNTPPSFHDPKSVLVSALPAVEPPQLPPLHAVDPNEMFCARKTSLVLPVEGAPLVFSSAYARELSLRLSGKDGRTIELPARADAAQGGIVVDTSSLRSTDLGDRISGSLQGYWGFDSYRGPSFELMNTPTLTLSAATQAALIVGREDTVHLQAVSVSCIEQVMLRDSSGNELHAQWGKGKADDLEVKLPLEQTQPGPLTLLITQYGAAQPQPLSMHAFSEAGRLDGFDIRAGDSQGNLRGSRLDQVASLHLRGFTFLPGKLSSGSAGDELTMAAKDPLSPTALPVGETERVQVALKDGRTFNLDATVMAPRPSVTLIGKSVELAGAVSHIELGDSSELPPDAVLTFSLRAESPPAFAHDARIEVATTDEAFSTQLSLSNGGLTLADARVAVANLDPARAFGASAFGPLQFRVIADGVTGAWQPLVTLVRLPTLNQLTCPTTAELACKLSGSNLFLIEAFSDDPLFAHPVQVPDGFSGYSLPVPHPSAGRLYVKLRDDPAIVNATVLPAQVLPPSADELARAPARHAAAVTAQSSPHATAGPPADSPVDAAPAPSTPNAPIPQAAVPAQPNATAPSAASAPAAQLAAPISGSAAPATPQTGATSPPPATAVDATLNAPRPLSSPGVSNVASSAPTPGAPH